MTPEEEEEIRQAFMIRAHAKGERQWGEGMSRAEVYAMCAGATLALLAIDPGGAQTGIEMTRATMAGWDHANGLGALRAQAEAN